MKIEYLEGNEWPFPLVRLFDYQPDEVNLLRHACNDLADGHLNAFALHDQSWTQSIAGCRFYWCVTSNDMGVRLPKHGEALVLEYSDEAWREVEGKLSSIVEMRPNAFNWLTMEGEVQVLISMDGKW